MSTEEPNLEARNGQDLATYEPGDVVGYPLFIDLIALLCQTSRGMRKKREILAGLLSFPARMACVKLGHGITSS